MHGAYVGQRQGQLEHMQFPNGGKGSKQNTGESLRRTSAVLPNPQGTSIRKERSKQSACTIADSPSEFVQWLKNLVCCKIWVKVTLQYSNKQTNKNIFCPSPLISAYSDMTFITLVNVYCLSLKDLVLAQCGKLGSNHKSRGVLIIRMKHK